MKSKAPGIGQLLAQSSSAMLLANDERAIVDANPAASDLLGVGHSDLIGMKIEELSSPELRGAASEMFEAFLRDGSQSGPYTLIRGDGTEVECSYSASANIGPGLHLSILVPREKADTELDSDSSDRKDHQDRVDQVELTDREREILTMLALGETNQTIATELNLAPETVRTHTRTARLRLGARSRSHAITLALQSGQLDLD